MTALIAFLLGFLVGLLLGVIVTRDSKEKRMKQREEFLTRLRNRGLCILLLVSLSFLPADASVHAFSRTAKFAGKEASKGGHAVYHVAKRVLAQIF